MATITNTKLSQGQIKGNDKVSLNAEMLAVEAAIKAAVGGVSYESAPAIPLSEVGAMIDQKADGKMKLLVSVDADSKSIGSVNTLGAAVGSFSTSVTAPAVNGTTATFTTTHAGVLDGSSATFTAALDVSGVSTFGDDVTIAAGKSLTVGGDLIVNGTTTTVNSSELVVDDNNIVIAAGKPSLVGGEGFSLVSDTGAHKMQWSTLDGGKWAISDGVLTPSVKVDSKLALSADAVASHASDSLHLLGGVSFFMKDSFMGGAELDLGRAGEHAAIFGASGWSAGSSFFGALGKERSDRLAAETAIVNDYEAAVLAEQQRAMGVEADLQDAIDAEASARASADQAHDTAIANEILRATGAEQALEDALDAEVLRATGAENTIAQNLASEITNRIADVDAEESRATLAEQALSGRIDTEVSDRAAADLSIRSDYAAADIGVRNYADGIVLAEKQRAEGIEGGLRTDLNAEVTNRVAAVLAEKQRAEGIEAGLRSDLTAEITRAQGAELVLSQNLAAEVTRAMGVEDGLRTDLTAEITRAQNAESVLNGKIETLKTDISKQALAKYLAVVGQGGVAADAVLEFPAGVDAQGAPVMFAKPAAKAAGNYDMFVNGQMVVWNSDFVFTAEGKVSFKYALEAGDVIAFREH